ncbi:hypothetical protein ACYPKM_05020 [Pseudomonas aeruginosa]
MNLPSLTLTITSSLGDIVQPPDGIKLARPFPNQRYVVAGTKGCMQGWTFELPEGVHDFDLQLCWSGLVSIDGIRRIWTVTHNILITLAPGEYNCYSMMAQTWPYIEGQPSAVKTNPTTPFGLEYGDPNGIMSSHRTIHDAEVLPKMTGFKLTELLHVPSTAFDVLKACMSQYNTAPDTRSHVVSPTNFVKEHLDCASAVMPARVFLRALELAEENAYQGEGNPCLQYLSAWWEQNKGPENVHTAAFVIPYVRKLDDDMYVDIHYGNDMAIPIPKMACYKPCLARVGEHVVVLFMASSRLSRRDENGWPGFINTVDEITGSVSLPLADVQSLEHDEAEFYVLAMAQFRQRYRSAYQQLKELAETEQLSFEDSAFLHPRLTHNLPRSKAVH